jgi:protein-S-isoprenylcysteine O-methyltransferase Ste14
LRRHFFENRIPPPLVLAAGAGFAWACSVWLPQASVDMPGSGGGAAFLAAAGLAVDLAALVSFLRARTTVNPLKPQAASALVTGGLYRISRNPMYLGQALLLAGWAVWMGNLLSLLAVPAFVAWIDRLQIAPEERALEAAFGDAFRDWAARVRRWF